MPYLLTSFWKTHIHHSKPRSNIASFVNLQASKPVSLLFFLLTCHSLPLAVGLSCYRWTFHKPRDWVSFLSVVPVPNARTGGLKPGANNFCWLAKWVKCVDECITFLSCHTEGRGWVGLFSIQGRGQRWYWHNSCPNGLKLTLWEDRPGSPAACWDGRRGRWRSACSQASHFL